MNEKLLINKNEAREKLERYKEVMNLSKFNPDGRIELLELWSQRVLNMDYKEAEKWLMLED